MKELSWHGGLLYSLRELCIGLARFKHRILDQHLLLSYHAQPKREKMWLFS